MEESCGNEDANMMASLLDIYLEDVLAKDPILNHLKLVLDNCKLESINRTQNQKEEKMRNTKTKTKNRRSSDPKTKTKHLQGKQSVPIYEFDDAPGGIGPSPNHQHHFFV